MSLIITPFYAGLLALFYVYLTLRVVNQRTENRVSIGAGKSRLLERAMRVHANFSEYTPIILLLIAFAELLGTPSLGIHALALIFIVGRLMHAYGLGQEPDNFKFRSWGMYLTAGVIICAAITCIVLSGHAMIAGI